MTSRLLSPRAVRVGALAFAVAFPAFLPAVSRAALAFHVGATSPKALATATSTNATIRKQQLICDPSVSPDASAAVAPTFMPIYAFTGYTDWENEAGAIVPDPKLAVGPDPEQNYNAVVDTQQPGAGIVVNTDGSGGRIYFKGTFVGGGTIGTPATTGVAPAASQTPPLGDVNLCTLTFDNADANGTFVPIARFVVQYTSLTVHDDSGNTVVIPQSNIEFATAVTNIPEPAALAAAAFGPFAFVAMRRRR